MVESMKGYEITKNMYNSIINNTYIYYFLVEGNLNT